jgi:hypothetical protein
LGSQSLLLPKLRLRREVVMSKVITFDKGSKRRLKQIRWKLIEIFTLALFAILIFATSLFVLMWELQHEHPHAEPTKVPQIKSAEPTEP